MKNILKLSVYIAFTMFLGACQKVFEVTEPVLEINELTVSDVEDTEGNMLKRVTFHLNSEADVISFYSGEVGNDYAYKDERIVKLLDLTLSFSTLIDGVVGGQGPEHVSIMASSDFSGEHTEEAIQAATWIDITDRFAISPIVGTNDPFLPSGRKDISDLTEVGKPIYLAVRYAVEPQPTVVTHNRMRLRNWLVMSKTEMGPAILANQGSGWTLTEIGAWRDGRNSVTSSQLMLRGNHLTGAGFLPEHRGAMEVWAISGQTIEAGDIDLGPDRPLIIKSYIDDPMTTFTYDYKDYGEYEAVFVLSNVNSKNEQKIIKKISVVVPEDVSNITISENYTVSKHFDLTSKTHYFLSRINHKDQNGNMIKLMHGVTNNNYVGETVSAFAARVGAALAFNASTQCPVGATNMMPCAVSIVDGDIIRNNPATNRYTLGIKENNELVIYPPETTASQILQDGVNNVLTAFVPLIENFYEVSDLELDLTGNSYDPHPRQIIAQLENLDIVFLSCGGRGYDGPGMTAKDAIRVLKKHKVKTAYMLDGGGSVTTVVNGQRVTLLIDGNGEVERPRPTFLYFMPM